VLARERQLRAELTALADGTGQPARTGSGETSLATLPNPPATGKGFKPSDAVKAGRSAGWPSRASGSGRELLPIERWMKCWSTTPRPGRRCGQLLDGVGQNPLRHQVSRSRRSAPLVDRARGCTGCLPLTASTSHLCHPAGPQCWGQPFIGARLSASGGPVWQCFPR